MDPMSGVSTGQQFLAPHVCQGMSLFERQVSEKWHFDFVSRSEMHRMPFGVMMPHLFLPDPFISLIWIL
jgi:hypothetical protein